MMQNPFPLEASVFREPRSHTRNRRAIRGAEAWRCRYFKRLRADGGRSVNKENPTKEPGGSRPRPGTRSRPFGA